VLVDDEVAARAGYDLLSFGRFDLDPKRRVLLKDGRRLRLGGRSLEILIALAERVGEVVTKRELVSRLWPRSVVEDGTLRVHICALRKTLGEREADACYVENVSGRGYRLTVPVLRRSELTSSTAAHSSSAPVSSSSVPTSHRTSGLPMPLTPLIDHAQVVKMLATRVQLRRFVTITGPGGAGKTTVALRVADKLAPAYPNGVCFVEFASITQPRLVAEGLASALGLAPASTDPLAGVLTFIAGKSMLLVLDSCEHVVETAAQIAESVLKGAPNVHLLVTCREPLRAESESVHRLAPLATPPAASRLTLSETLAFPAIQLFVERAAASLDTFELEEADAPVVAEICRGLGGNPLAIEVAAERVDLGLRGLAACLKDGMQLAIKGRRTTVPRHQTLRASLDWSHDLLPDPERTIFRRLATLVGDFDLELATHVVAEGELDAAAVFDGIISLVAKSLLSVEPTGEKAVYRLLDTTRAYALEKLRDAGELAQTRRRLAQVRPTSKAAEVPAQAELGASNPPLARRSGMSGQLLNELALGLRAPATCDGPEIPFTPVGLARRSDLTSWPPEHGQKSIVVRLVAPAFNSPK